MSTQRRFPSRLNSSPQHLRDPNVSSLYATIKTSPPASTSTRRPSPEPLRIAPQHQPVGSLSQQQHELDPDQGALQFVPAFQKSSSRSASRPKSRPRTVIPSKQLTTSWDVEEKKEADATSSTSAAARKSGRIARLASLFSSRATVSETTPTPTTKMPATKPIKSPIMPTPSSPVHSSSSSGYVGWPGTIDKLGDTVSVRSFDESSAGGGGGGGGPAKSNSNSNDYERELQQAAEREMTRWTGRSTASDEYSTSNSSSLSRSSPEQRARAISAERRRPSSIPLDKRYNSIQSRLKPNVKVTEKADALNGDKYFATGSNPEPKQFLKPSISLRVPHSSDVGRPKVGALASSSRTAGTTARASAASLNLHNLFSADKRSQDDPWASDGISQPSASPKSNDSKSSSGYARPNDINELAYPEFKNGLQDNGFRVYGVVPSRPDPVTRHRSDSPRRAKPEVVATRHRSASPHVPTEQAVAANNHLSPPHRPIPAKGYRGLIDKTKDVPSLMDAMDSDNSSRATSTYSSAPPSQAGGPSNGRSYRDRPNEGDSDSDVFDGVSISKESDVFDNLSWSSPRKAARSRLSLPARIAEEGEHEVGAPDPDFKVVKLGGGLTAIQTSEFGFSKRRTASDYDENLTNSDVDQYGYAKTPSFHEMLNAGMRMDNSLIGIDGNLGNGAKRRPDPPSKKVVREDPTSSESDSSLFTDPHDDGYPMADGDLSEYYIPQSEMKKVLAKYRRMTDHINVDLSLDDFDREEDEHKAFALFEMRSRIMEKDIERGLERQGGTVPVDDLVLTAYHRSAHRVRDAVIVCKAWRDGASPKDVINAARLTQRDVRTYYIKRPVRSDSSKSSDAASTFSGYSGYAASSRYWWEPVKWIDDTDFLLHRCPSLGPRNMRGSEMFTIGDCQSILLKLTNEQCLDLRKELNKATKRQIEAEDRLKEEGDADDGMMTDVEMDYLTSMEEVKTISRKLVAAEQSFHLVRDRIQKLITRYERILTKIESESLAGASSVLTMESSYFSERDSGFWEDRERAIWARRAQRAEVKAEIAAREALLAKQEVQMVRDEKQRELDILQQKLLELQSESSLSGGTREHSAILARNYNGRRLDGASSAHEQNQSLDKQKLDDVKKRFRDRMATRKQQPVPPHQTMPPAVPNRNINHHMTPRNVTPSPKHTQVQASSRSPPATRELFRSAGEEMYQQLDFYERSLRAVADSLH